MSRRFERLTLGQVEADRPQLRSRVWLLAVGGIALIVGGLAMMGVDGPAEFALALSLAVGAALAVFAWAIHRSARLRRSYEERLTQWAAERAVADERLRIARDLHDLASHGLGLITVRAASVRSLTGSSADAERAAALADIERSGRAATAELRRLLTVLRTAGDPAPFRPAATLADLHARVAEARAAGVGVTVHADGLLEADCESPTGQSSLPAATQIAIHAVVREGLANVARHAGPTTARVTVREEGGGVVVEVDDDGPSPAWQPHSGAGVGLIGLRERVVLEGGTLSSAQNGRGFRLRAWIPVRDGNE